VVVVDGISMDMINQATIDYKEEMIRSSFEVIANPNAESGCSCGVSFTPKMF
jgi:iron-sulfur cluster assembly accessory protein